MYSFLIKIYRIMPSYIQKYATKNALTLEQVKQLYEVEKDLAQRLPLELITL